MYLVFNADRIPVNGEVSLQVAAGVFHGSNKSFLVKQNFSFKAYTIVNNEL